MGLNRWEMADILARKSIPEEVEAVHIRRIALQLAVAVRTEADTTAQLIERAKAFANYMLAV